MGSNDGDLSCLGHLEATEGMGLEITEPGLKSSHFTFGSFPKMRQIR